MKADYKGNKLTSNRRAFLHRGLMLAAGAPLGWRFASESLCATERSAAPPARADAKVAIVSCRSYGPEVRAALAKSFDLLGGVGSLVKNRTVTVKLNLTGTMFDPIELTGGNRKYEVGETFMTHYSTALALAAVLFAN